MASVTPNLGLPFARAGIVAFKQGFDKAMSILDSALGGAGAPPSAAIPSLTGTVGTADNAMTALANVPAAPADATALATYINATLLPALNNDLADLQAKTNTMLATLRTRGQILP